MARKPKPKVDQLTPIILAIAGSLLVLAIGLFVCFVGAFGIGRYLLDHPHAPWWLTKLADISYALMPVTGLVGIIMCFYVCVSRRRMSGLAWLLLPIPFVILFFAFFGRDVSA